MYEGSNYEGALQRGVCPNCGSTEIVLDEDEGEYHCKRCGLVLGKVYSLGPEWRNFGDEESEQRDRAGSPLSPLIHDLGLTTSLDAGPKSASGRDLSEDEKSRAVRLRVWQQRSRVYGASERNVVIANRYITHIADQLDLPRNVVMRAAIIYRKALEKGLVRGRPINSMAAAAVYAACRSSEVPRTLKEVAAKAGLRKKEVARSYRMIVGMAESKMPLVNPIIYISKVASKMKVPPAVEAETIKILKEAMGKRATSGKDPMGLVAAAMYMAAQRLGVNTFTQKQIAEAANVTEVTVRNRYKGLKELLGEPAPAIVAEAKP